jgi:hypothetical protein
MGEILLPDVLGVLDALAYEVNAKGRNVRMVGRKTDESIIAKAHRQAWMIYRDGPLRERFRSGNGKAFGFSKRSIAYAGNDVFREDNRLGKPGTRVPGGRIRKGNLPDYVFTGRFRDQLAKRGTRRASTPNETRTRFSIFGGALNLLGSQRGNISEVISQQRAMRTRPAHTRRDGRSGKTVSVRGYQQMAIKTERKVTKSPRTYADEWAFMPGETDGVQKDADRLILEGFRSAIYDPRTKQIKTTIRARMRGADA